MPGAGAAEAARPRPTARRVVEVGGQEQRHRRHRPRTRTSRPRSTRPAARSSTANAAGTSASTPKPPATIDELARPADRPAARDERSSTRRRRRSCRGRRPGTAPRTPAAVSSRSKPLAHQVDREPVRDHEPDGIGERRADAMAPQVCGSDSSVRTVTSSGVASDAAAPLGAPRSRSARIIARSSGEIRGCDSGG